MNTRKCPLCQKELTYNSERDCRRAEEKQRKCRSCTHKTRDPKTRIRYPKQDRWVRNCPECNCEIEYKSGVYMRDSERRGKKCKSCGIKEYCKIRDYNGENNPFYGKKHTEKTREKFVEIAKNRPDDYISEQGRKNQAESSKKRKYEPFFDIWLRKYGLEGANKRYIEYKEACSTSHSGEKNYWYGKKRPLGVGNGWKGWYNGQHFRSLLELSYIITVLEAENMDWKSAEDEGLVIKYKFDGKNKTYRPDFIVDDEIIIECKPKSLQTTRLVLAKKEAAEKYCEENGMTYIMVDIPILPWEKIIELYDNHEVSFTHKYEEKLKVIIQKIKDGKTVK